MGSTNPPLNSLRDFTMRLAIFCIAPWGRAAAPNPAGVNRRTGAQRPDEHIDVTPRTFNPWNALL
jgi:hypothetical protein